MNNIIFYRPGPQSENAGDVLINREAVKLMLRYGKVIILSKGLPKKYIDEISSGEAVSINKGFSNVIFTALKSLFGSATEDKNNTIYFCLPPGHLRKEGRHSLISAFRILAFLLPFWVLRGRVFRLGHSIEGRAWLNGFLESLISRLCRIYGVRDEISLAYCDYFKFKNYRYFPDFSWALSTLSKQSDEKNDIVVLSFRSNKHGRLDQEEYLNEHIGYLRNMVVTEGYKHYKYIVSYQVGFDKAAAERIFMSLKLLCNIEMIPDRLDVEDARKLYAEARYVFSNRLHVLMLAGFSGALPIALIKGRDHIKINSLFIDSNIQDCLIDVEANTLDRLAYTVEKTDELMKSFNAAAKKNKEIMQTVLDECYR